jgi:hypothetical protein
MAERRFMFEILTGNSGKNGCCVIHEMLRIGDL